MVLRYFFGQVSCFNWPWCHSVLPKVPYFIGHGAAVYLVIGPCLSAIVPHCLGHGLCVAAMVPQCSSLSYMFTGHGATVSLARCHVLSAMAPQYFCQCCYVIGLGATSSWP